MALITIREAAERVGVTRQAIDLAIREGRLTRHEKYGKLLVSEAELVHYKPQVRPRKEKMAT